MMLHKLRSLALKKNTLNQQSVSKLELAHPEWTLFDRMKHADQLYNQPNSIDYETQRNEYKQRSQTIVEIKKDDFTEKNLIDAIKSLSKSGGEIRLPEGKLELTNTIKLTSGICLTGVQRRTDLFFKQCDYGITIQGTDQQSLKNISITNLRIYHEGDHKFCAAIFATHASELHLENIDIISPRAVGILLADKVDKTKLINCRVKHAGLVGFMFIRDVNETLMKNCVAEYSQQGGVFLTDLKLPKTIDPLDFQAQLDHTDHIIGNFAPFSIDDPSPFRTDIIDCVFKHNRKMGITTDGIAYLSVKNTVISDNDCEGITIDNGSWGCIIQNCHIFNNGWRGLQHKVELGIDFVNEMGLMDDGSSKAKLPGISLDNAAYTRIENNHIECNWGDGVKFVRAAYGGTVANNLIENNNRGVNDKFHYFGILVGIAERQHNEQHDFASCNNTLSNNTILGQHFAGIHLMKNVTGNVIEKNLISGATFESIEVHATSGNVINT